MTIAASALANDGNKIDKVANNVTEKHIFLISLPIPRNPISFGQGFESANVSAAPGHAVPSLTLVMKNPRGEIEPDDNIVRAMLLGGLLSLEQV